MSLLKEENLSLILRLYILIFMYRGWRLFVGLKLQHTTFFFTRTCFLVYYTLQTLYLNQYTFLFYWLHKTCFMCLINVLEQRISHFVADSAFDGLSDRSLEHAEVDCLWVQFGEEKLWLWRHQDPQASLLIHLQRKQSSINEETT